MIHDGNHLLHAANEMDKAFEACGIYHYDLDNLGETLLELYDEQQKKYLRDHDFSLISTLSFALLELGIIENAEDTNDLE